MTYSITARLARDAQLTERIAACAAQEGLTSDPVYWAQSVQWRLAGTPGWSEAYAHAVGIGRGAPGHDHDVINDDMILAAVQPMIAALV